MAEWGGTSPVSLQGTGQSLAARAVVSVSTEPEITSGGQLPVAYDLAPGPPVVGDAVAPSEHDIAKTSSVDSPSGSSSAARTCPCSCHTAAARLVRSN